MSFSFDAIGSRSEVIGQLSTHMPVSKLEHAARRLAAEAIEGDTDSPPGVGRQLRYVVRGSGHDGGGMACCLHLTIDAVAVPEPAARF